MKKLQRITIDTNPEDCNLKCIMCEEHSPYSNYIQELEISTGIKKRRMELDILEKLFKEAKELGVKEMIPSTMGEPLLYKHFDRILELCNIYDIELNLTTNGTFPKKSIPEWANLLVPLCSDIKISFNGFDSIGESIMLGTKSKKILSNIISFLKIKEENHFKKKTSLTLQMTFLETNYKEIQSILEFSYIHKIDRLKGHHLWAHFHEIKNLDMRRDENSILNWNQEIDKLQELDKNYQKKYNHKVKLENFTKINSVLKIEDTKSCPFLNKELWISATGKISPCCAPDNLRNSLGDFGNFYQRSLTEVLNSSEYQLLVENYKTYDLCKTCLLRK
jgi:MoaA/NifB/PqqE/SkfB family radical SAM enzyme